MSAGGTAARSASLPWVLALYVAATLLHFAHNAEYLAQYPNLPDSWSRGEVYAAWGAVTALGVGGYGGYLLGYRRIGLTILGCYAALGFAGLLHYTRASIAHHSAMMNVTIWVEAVAGAVLLANVPLAAGGGRGGSRPRKGDS